MTSKLQPSRNASLQPRTLRFDTLDDVTREANRISAADAAGVLRTTGTWSPGQTFNHLATWMNFAFDGYPPTLNPPWIIKLILRMQKRRFLTRPMPRGVRIPRITAGTLGTEPMSIEEGHLKLRHAVERLRSTAPIIPNPIFGQLTHREWIEGNLRHAELHLGYFIPPD